MKKLEMIELEKIEGGLVCFFAIPNVFASCGSNGPMCAMAIAYANYCWES